MQMLSFIIAELMLAVISIILILLLVRDEGARCRKKQLRYYLVGSGSGMILALFTGSFKSMETVVAFGLLGLLASAVLTLFYEIVRRVLLEKKPVVYYDDGTPRKFYITGDKHRNFKKVKEFCRDMNTRKKDVLIILGDAGFNYYGDERDDQLKKEISSLNITLFCIHGNKENRPQNIETYGIKSFCGGKVYYEPKYPRILFAKDGEIYQFEGKKYLVAGGAHSVDKQRCLEEDMPFWEDEMPSEETKAAVEEALEENDFALFGMLTHTCPLRYLPQEMFVSTRQKAKMKRKFYKTKPKKIYKPDIDRSTEAWLDALEQRLTYNVWFCGHYHADKQIDKIYMLCNEIRPLHFNMVNEEIV